MDVFKGLSFHEPSIYTSGNLSTTDMTFLLQPHSFYGSYTLNPEVAAIFAMDPKNQWLHDARTSPIAVKASSRGNEAQELERYLNYVYSHRHHAMKPGAFGIIIQAQLPQEKIAFETYEHLLEQEVNFNYPIVVRNIGTITKNFVNPKWLPKSSIPKSAFTTAKTLSSYIEKHGKRKQWKSSTVPTLLAWAIQDITNYDQDSAYRMVIDLSEDVHNLYKQMKKYEKMRNQR